MMSPKLWKHEVGLGFSSVIEVDGLAYTQGYRNDQNTLFCVDVLNGDIKWSIPMNPFWVISTSGEAGPPRPYLKAKYTYKDTKAPFLFGH